MDQIQTFFFKENYMSALIYKLNIKGLISTFLIISSTFSFPTTMKTLLKWKMAALCRHQGIQVNITNNGNNKHHMTRLMYTRTCSIPARNHEETDKPKLKDVLQNNWPVLFKNVKGMKDKEKLRTKET